MNQGKFTFAWLLFNIAVCQKNLRKYSKMLATVRRYLEDGAPILSADDKTQAQEIVKTVEGRHRLGFPPR